MAATPDPALPMPSDNESLTEIESQALSELDAVANDDEASAGGKRDGLRFAGKAFEIG